MMTLKELGTPLRVPVKDARQAALFFFKSDLIFGSQHGLTDDDTMLVDE